MCSPWWRGENEARTQTRQSVLWMFSFCSANWSGIDWNKLTPSSRVLKLQNCWVVNGRIWAKMINGFVIEIGLTWNDVERLAILWIVWKGKGKVSWSHGWVSRALWSYRRWTRVDRGRSGCWRRWGRGRYEFNAAVIMITIGVKICLKETQGNQKTKKNTFWPLSWTWNSLAFQMKKFHQRHCHLLILISLMLMLAVLILIPQRPQSISEHFYSNGLFNQLDPDLI